MYSKLLRVRLCFTAVIGSQVRLTLQLRSVHHHGNLELACKYDRITSAMTYILWRVRKAFNSSCSIPTVDMPNTLHCLRRHLRTCTFSTIIKTTKRQYDDIAKVIHFNLVPLFHIVTFKQTQSTLHPNFRWQQDDCKLFLTN